MRQSTKRLISSFFSLVLLAAAFMVFFAFIRPVYDDVAVVRAKKASLSDFVSHQESVVKQIKNLTATYEGGREVREVISLVMPLDPDLGGALAALNALMVQNEIAPQSFSVTVNAYGRGVGAPKPAQGDSSPSPLTKPIGSVQVQVRLVTTYEHLKSFLGEMETNVRLFDLKNISLQPIGKVTQDLYAVDITVAAYYQTR